MMPKDIIRRERPPLEGDVLDNLPTRQEPRTYDFTKEIEWTDAEFMQLPRSVVERIATLYREGRGTMVAEVGYRTWLPNRSIIRKPKLMEWATRIRQKGKYRWLEVYHATAGGGHGVITIMLIDRSYPGAEKQRWYQSDIHSSLMAGNWRKTIAYELRKMHRIALQNFRNKKGLRAINGPRRMMKHEPD